MEIKNKYDLSDRNSTEEIKIGIIIIHTCVTSRITWNWYFIEQRENIK